MLLGECAKCGQPVTDTQLKAGRGAQLGTSILCERCAPQPNSETIAAPAMGDETAKCILAVARPSDAKPTTPSPVPFDQVALSVDQDPHFKEMAGATSPAAPAQPPAMPAVPPTKDSTRRAATRPSTAAKQSDRSETPGGNPHLRRNVLLAAGLATTTFLVTLMCFLVFLKGAPTVTSGKSPDASTVKAGPASIPSGNDTKPLTATEESPEKTSVPADLPDYDPRAAVAASLLAEARAHHEKNPQDTLGYKRRLEELVQHHPQTPAGEEAAGLIAAEKVTSPSDSRPGVEHQLEPGLWVSYWTRGSEQDAPRQIVSRTEPAIQIVKWRRGLLDPAVPRENFCARFGGVLRVERGAKYVFSLSADDSAKLWIDELLQSESRRLSEKTFEVDLSPGNHAIRVEFLQAAGSAVMKVQWRLAGEPEFRSIPPEALWYDPAQKEAYEKP